MGERSLLRALEGGCSVPVGVDCMWEDDDAEEAPGHMPEPEPALSSTIQKKNQGYEADDVTPPATTDSAHSGLLTLRAMVVSLDGKECVQSSQRHHVGSDQEAEALAFRVYEELVGKGAEEILKKIRLNRDMIEGLDGA